MMKLIATLAISAALTGSAVAADLAARPYTKATVPAVYDWTGFYVGANGGGGWARKCWDMFSLFGAPRPVATEGCHDATGGTVGGQIGYRWQASNWVFGLEAQGNWADFKGSNTSLVFPAPFGQINRSKVDAFGLFTGQVGYAWNNVLGYVKGGAAVAHDKYEGIDIPTNAVFDRASETRWGAAVGAGIEYGFAPNWSLAVEYDHLFMGKRDIGFNFVPPFAGPSRGDTIRQDIDVVTARINYRFGGPVVARY